MSVGAAPLVADLRHVLLPGFFAFGVVFVISFRLLKSIFSLLIRPVFVGGAGCLLVLNNVFTLLIRPVFAGGAGCLLVLNNVFTLLIRPVFAGGAGCLLVLNIVDFLFRWLVAGAPICLYVRTDETFISPMSAAKPDDYIVVFVSRIGVLGVPCGALITCLLLGVSLAWFYRWRDRQATPRQRRRAEVDPAVKAMFEDAKGVHGSQRLHADLTMSVRASAAT